MREQTFAVRLCLVQRSHAEIAVTAASRADAYVVAENLARSNAVQFCAEGEELEVASVIESNAQPIAKGKAGQR